MNMKWSPEKIAELLDIAREGLTDQAAGDHFGCSASAAYQQCLLRGFVMKRGPRQCRVTSSGLRQRWAVLIGPMKEHLRADIARIG